MKISKLGMVESNVRGIKQEDVDKLEAAARSLMSRLFLDKQEIKIKILPTSEMYNRGEAFNHKSKYLIHLNSGEVKRNFREAVTVLAHEMVHVMQYNRGWLKFDGVNDLWMGKPVKRMAWNRRPWEKQAVELEASLAEYALS